MAKIGRNDRCPCGSGKKYKQCCLAKDEAAERKTSVAAPAADHLPHHHPRLCKDCNAKIDAAANAVSLSSTPENSTTPSTPPGRWSSAGPTCMTATTASAWFTRRGEKSQAAEYYRKVVAFARKDPSFYDPDFEDYYQDLIDRLDPAHAWGLCPQTPGIFEAQ